MIKDQIIKSLRKATTIQDIQLEFPDNPSHGDYSSNIALKADRKQLRDWLPQAHKGAETLRSTPIEIANVIDTKLSNDKELTETVSKIEVAPPGFINFFLSPDTLFNNLNNVLTQKGNYGRSEIGKGKTVVIDYSSPNIAKRFSIGHLRSTIIGQALYNIYSFLGWKTIGDNHLGDWGTQFGVLIYMVESNNMNPSKLTINDWEELYVSFHKKLDQNPGLKDEARKAFVRLEKGDSKAKSIWQAAYDTSMAEYNQIYQKLGIEIDHAYGESFYQDKIPEAVELAKKKGVAQKSGKAWAIEFDAKYHLPSNLLIKSNGTTTYLTRDLALMFFRKRKWNPDLQIFEVGADQKLYFKQVFAMAEMMGIFRLDQLKHLAHGMIRLKEGRMSTRNGKTVKLEEVITESIARAKSLGSESDQAAEKVGIGAIKWNDLKRDPTGDIIFDWGEVLNMGGNSGPYIQYTFARTQSVLKKSHFAVSQTLSPKSSSNQEELILLRTFSQFPEIIISAAKNYSPNLLCNYLYRLSQEFNTFYNIHKIIASDNKAFRLALTFATGQVLKTGLTLLGIEAPEKM
jgi:arginyl-tRNA synthetase